MFKKAYDVQVQVVGWSDRRNSVKDGDDSVQPEDVLSSHLEKMECN
jgi:hypothetical protein